MLLEHCKSKRQNKSMAWIDYRKAFDSVSHNWIIKSLELFKLSPIIVNFLKSSMLNWKTTLFLSHKFGNLKFNPVEIKSGIFQGDSFSPLHFCLSLYPLTNEVNRTVYGYKIGKKIINSLLYMDDQKLFPKDDHELTDSRQWRYSMKLGL